MTLRFPDTIRGIRGLMRPAILIFLWAVALNYPWEMLQMPLYRGMAFNDVMSWILCFRASLGDGLIILIIWGFGALVFRDPQWFRTPGLMKILLLTAAGALIAIGVEIHAISTFRWQYSPLMPVIPFLNVGLSPLLQLLILPWLSMRLARAVTKR